MEDIREDVFNKLIMLLIDRKVDVSSCKDEIYGILSEYEMQPRETLPAVLEEERNDYLFKKFITSKIVKGCTPRTIKYYRNTIPIIISKIGKTVDDVTADDIRLYFAKRKMIDKVSKCTQQNEQRCLSSFFTYLYQEEVVKKNPMLKVEIVKLEKTKREAFTEMEIEILRNECKTGMDKAIIEVLLSTGCRITELINIKIDDIKTDRLIVHGKGEKDRIVYLNAKAQMSIQQYLSERTDYNEYLFPSTDIAMKNLKGNKKEWYKNPDYVDENKHITESTIENKIRKMGQKHDIKAHPHKFRRTCATMALRRGMPIEQVSKMLGHESIETTQIYLDLNEEDLALAHKKYVI